MHYDPKTGISSPERIAAFSEALRSANTKQARREVIDAFLNRSAPAAELRDNAVNRFMAAQAPAEEMRFTRWLRGGGVARAFEDRAMGEGTTATGGALVPARFSNSVIHYMREYSSFLGAFEHWESEGGEAYNRAAYSEFTATSAVSENAAITEGPEPTIFQQAWPQAPTYAASYTASNQLVYDAFASVVQGGASAFNPLHNFPVDGGPGIGTVYANPAPDIYTPNNPALDALVSAALGESLGRAIAPVAATALYAAISGVGVTSGQDGGYLQLGAATAINFTSGATTELAANTINLDTAAQMVGAIDAAYLDGAAYYFSQASWTGLIRQVDAQKHIQIDPGLGLKLYGFPVVLTGQTSTATASTVSGPVFGNLGAALTLRTVQGSFGMVRDAEKFAEFLQTYFRCWLRADVKTRDARAVVGVKYAAT